AALVQARQALRDARSQRVHPTLDPKQITSWNALTTAGLLRAARAGGRDDWTALAQRTLDFIRDRQWDGSRLHAVHNAGESRFHGYLDDYAFTLDALLESLRTAWRRQDLDFAIDLADALLLRFEDEENGGFFFNDGEQPTPIARSMVVQDDATPAAYAYAIGSLQQLAGLIGESRYHAAAVRALERAGGGIEQHPVAFASAARAAIRLGRPVPQVLLRGSDPQRVDPLRQWLATLPVHSYLISDGDGDPPLPGLLEAIATSKPVSAWVCHGMRCLPPVHSRSDLESLLTQTD
ncbi:MAG: hypothetical protein R3212_10500, partial [Xanthomonadales bacterium]|nr:hypothetical protein [Xanthomonadales bacterium]